MPTAAWGAILEIRVSQKKESEDCSDERQPKRERGKMKFEVLQLLTQHFDDDGRRQHFL